MGIFISLSINFKYSIPKWIDIKHILPATQQSTTSFKTTHYSTLFDKQINHSALSEHRSSSNTASLPHLTGNTISFSEDQCNISEKWKCQEIPYFAMLNNLKKNVPPLLIFIKTTINPFGWWLIIIHCRASFLKLLDSEWIRVQLTKLSMPYFNFKTILLWHVNIGSSSGGGAAALRDSLFREVKPQAWQQPPTAPCRGDRGVM